MLHVKINTHLELGKSLLYLQFFQVPRCYHCKDTGIWKWLPKHFCKWRENLIEFQASVTPIWPRDILCFSHWQTKCHKMVQFWDCRVWTLCWIEPEWYAKRNMFKLLIYWQDWIIFNFLQIKKKVFYSTNNRWNVSPPTLVILDESILIIDLIFQCKSMETKAKKVFINALNVLEVQKNVMCCAFVLLFLSQPCASRNSQVSAGVDGQPFGRLSLWASPQ